MTLASDALAIARAGVEAVDPAGSVTRALVVDPAGFRAGGFRVPFAPNRRVHVVAFGKASSAMADAAAAALGRDRVSGVVVVRAGNPRPHGPWEVLESDHPVVTERSLAAGRRLVEYVASVPETEPTLFLVSGGASALVEVPASGLDLEDLARTDERLLAGGVPIQAMNAVRRHLSRLKGGGLALAAASARYVTLAISDVVGDAPHDVASGPTVGDPTTFREALAAVAEYRLQERLPRRVVAYLEAGRRGRRPETPAPDDPRLRRGRFAFVATNRRAVAGAVAEARRRGYATRVLSTALVGESRDAGEAFARRVASARRAVATARPSCLLAGGETTVTLGARPGRGGRNQEFALAAARPLANRPFVHVLSIGTDGIDGPTDAAGGWVDGTTWDRAALAGVDLDKALATHDAYPALARLGGLVVTGPTGTNVMDLHVGLSASRSGTGRTAPSRPGSPSRRRRS